MEKYKELFLEEVDELLEELENLLLKLETDPKNKELINNAFRVMHTIKGSSGMFGFNEVSKFTHNIENVYDNIRNGKLEMSKEIIEITLQAKDQIRIMVGEEVVSDADYEDILKRLTASFKSYLPDKPENVKEEQSKVETKEIKREIKKGETLTYRIRFKPSENIFLHGTNPLMILKELRSMGETSIIANLSKIPDLNKINPEICYIWWDIVLTTTRELNLIKDVFIFLEESSDIKIDIIDYGEGFDIDYKRLGEILVERGDVANEELSEIISKKKLIGDLLTDSKLVNPGEVESALVEQDYMKKLKENRTQTIKTSSIRVKSEKLDILVNLVGELVSAQAQLSENVKEVHSADLFTVAEVIERITAELRENAMNIRMMPIGTTFGKFVRLVRDLSNDLGKKVALLTEGAETELDKTVIEKLNDPLIHIIRNCIDHGVEMPDERKKNNKPVPAIIKLSAAHEGTNVAIKIFDNGAGINKEKVREKAVKLGFLKKDEQIADSELFSFLFHPGFSTIKKVTEISGRGVGMDVVKKAIDNLNGHIVIESEEGVGTTISLKLPLTLAIIEGLLVELSNQHFVIPLTTVEECIEYIQDEKNKDLEEDCIDVHGEFLPFIKLRKKFMILEEPPSIQQIVVVRSGTTRVGLLVDKVIGSNQTVIKPLSKIINDMESISGATILGDGSVAFIIDINKITKIAVAGNLDEL